MITTTGVFTTHASAEKALLELRKFGVSEKDLSYLYLHQDGDIKDGQSGEKVSGAALTGAAAGGVIGGIAGMVIANGLIPGLGAFIAAGPIATALGLTEVAATIATVATTGAVAGGLIGGLAKLGIAEEDARLYEEHVRKGGVLVIARGTEASTEDIFKRNGATEVKHYTTTE